LRRDHPASRIRALPTARHDQLQLFDAFFRAAPTFTETIAIRTDVSLDRVPIADQGGCGSCAVVIDATSPAALRGDALESGHDCRRRGSEIENKHFANLSKRVGAGFVLKPGHLKNGNLGRIYGERDYGGTVVLRVIVRVDAGVARRNVEKVETRRIGAITRDLEPRFLLLILSASVNGKADFLVSFIGFLFDQKYFDAIVRGFFSSEWASRNLRFGVTEAGDFFRRSRDKLEQIFVEFNRIAKIGTAGYFGPRSRD
jgi:hypothetical protein